VGEHRLINHCSIEFANFSEIVQRFPRARRKALDRIAATIELAAAGLRRL
jgi:hypothetical protein